MKALVREIPEFFTRRVVRGRAGNREGKQDGLRRNSEVRSNPIER